MLRIFISIFLLVLIVSPSVSRAGCPAVPSVEASFTATACRFYRAEDDADLVKRVNAHYAEGWNDAPGEQIAKNKALTFQQNTGALLKGTTSNKEEEQKFFYRSADENVCDTFSSGSVHRVTIHTTCPMVFFEAPRNQVIELIANQ